MSQNRLHIYEQKFEHDSVLIIGNRESLIALRDAIDFALFSNEEGIATCSLFAQDNEGYEIIIVEDNENNFVLPYPIIGLGLEKSDYGHGILPYDVIDFDKASKKFRKKKM